MIDRVRRARALDLCNPFDILDLQVTAAFENFQRVLFVSEAQPLGFPDAERDDAGRRIFPGRAMRRLPVKVISNSIVAPFRRVLVVEWRTAIVSGGRGVGLIGRLDRDICELNVRHRRSAPGKGHHISAGRGSFVSEGRFHRRTEAKAVAGSEYLPRSAFDDDERTREHPQRLADMGVG